MVVTRPRRPAFLIAVLAFAVARVLLAATANVRAAPSGDDVPEQIAPASNGETTPVRYFETRAQAWRKIPSVTVAGATGDPRRELVAEAVEHWNQQLSTIGTPFRLGEISYVENSVADAEMVGRAAAFLSGQPLPPLSDSVRRLSGDLIVVLSDADFVSFSGLAGTNRPALVGISGYQGSRTLPNVMLNVITHEIGHTIGLGHNNSAALLMCGRPADCRPEAFQSSESRIFPVTDEERARLLTLYPSDWQPTQ